MYLKGGVKLSQIVKCQMSWSFTTITLTERIFPKLGPTADLKNVTADLKNVRLLSGFDFLGSGRSFQLSQF